MSLLDLEAKHLKYDRTLWEAMKIPPTPKPEQVVIDRAAATRPQHVERSVIVWHWVRFWEATINVS